MDISVLGGDKRIAYAAEYLDCFANVKTLTEDMFDGEIKKADCLLLGLPASLNGSTIINAPLFDTPVSVFDIPRLVKKNGVVAAGLINTHLRKVCDANGIFAEDYYEDETLVLKNAQLTAEGALALGINSTPRSIRNARILVTGYGRIAVFLARYLLSLGADVTVAARSKAKRTLAILDGCKATDFYGLEKLIGGFSLIYNTVPSLVITENEVSKMQTDTVYIELASSRGIDGTAEKHGINIISAPGLPSATAAKTAGEIIGESVLCTLKKYTL